MVREATEGDLGAILELYLDLHETRVPEDCPALRSAWIRILADDWHHLIVNEIDGQVVSSCVCVIIPNLTRGARPYALVENVVTRADVRGQGLATACMNEARRLAEVAGCYKIMLMTGSQRPETLDFYRRCGYNSADKTAFVQWLPMGDQK